MIICEDDKLKIVSNCDENEKVCIDYSDDEYTLEKDHFCDEYMLYIQYVDIIYPTLTDEEKKQINKIVIDDTTRAISENAFKDMINLKEVELGNSIEYIDSSAFAGCINLKFINMPKELKYIGESAFNGCENLQELNLPSSVNIICDYAFYNCKSLERVHLINRSTSNLEYIGIYAFAFSGIQGLDLPNQKLMIGYSAFSDCSNLEDICFSIKGKYYINDYAFKNCISLREVDALSTLRHIGSGAFMNCFSLERVTIDNKVMFVPRNAFENCEKLKEIEYIE